MKKVIELNSVDTIFSYYEEELATITEEDKKEIKKRNINVVQKEREMLTFIEKLEISDIIRKELVEKIENLFDDKSCSSSYYSEKYFKQGFSLGISLIIDAITKV